MPRIMYVDKRFGMDALAAIDHANRICRQYRDQGYDLTLRQLYYQFVAHDLFPEDRTWVRLDSGKWVRSADGTKNAEPNYKWLGDVVNDARLAGKLDWWYIVDRTRNVQHVTHWESPAEIIGAAAKPVQSEHPRSLH